MGDELFKARLTLKALLETYPELIGELPHIVTASIEAKLKSERELRAKTECALSYAMARKYKGNDEFFAENLEAINGHSFLNYSSVIKKLRGNTP